MTKLLLTISETAAAIGVSRPKVYSLFASDGLPWVKVGSRIRVPVAALAAWIDERAQRGAIGERKDDAA